MPTFEKKRDKNFLKPADKLFMKGDFSAACVKAQALLNFAENGGASPYYQAKAHHLIAKSILADIKSNAAPDEDVTARYVAAKTSVYTASTLFSKTERLSRNNASVAQCNEDMEEVEAVEILLTLSATPT
ncbi:MAG: hypothetical protein P4M12_07490 [Gammaproteobacteria bacterium]|nr:hypothetical protein [Gammaproteobacteria bacterium]